VAVSLMSWRTRWRAFEYVRNSIWIVPGLFGVIAIAAGLALPRFDEDSAVTIGIAFSADAARSVLGSIASGMIAFTGFVFSILLLAVQFGSSQFSPRMLRRFLRDPTTKFALGIFIATFIYSLVVLRLVGRPENPDFVPNTSVSVALALLLASMPAFLRLISQTTAGLRVASVLGGLVKDAKKSIDRVYPDPAPEVAGDEERGPAPHGPARRVAYRGEPGILQSVDARGLVARAEEVDVVIELLPSVGDLLIEGDLMFCIHGEAAVEEAFLQDSIAIGDERTMRQDPAFAFRLLADISSKALSPGVNDPTSAVQALDQIEVLLRILGRRRLTPGVVRDAGGSPRLLWPAPTWEDYLSLALDETRQFGEGSVQISRRMTALLERLRASVPSYRRPAVDEKLALVSAGAHRAFSDELDQSAAATSDPQGIGSSRPAIAPGEDA
jgi:uncharacterized membrane protein